MAKKGDSITSTDIARDGDVILAVGIGMRRLRAHSLVLKSVSGVFRAMLSPQFNEGQRLAENESVEINMPEDDAEAMEIILNVIHGYNNAIPDGLDASQILRLAVTADKFDCNESLAFASNVWLNCESITNSSQLWLLLKAAYWFDDAKSFKEISVRLMFHHRGSYLQLWTQDDIDNGIWVNICLSLEEARNGIRQSLVHEVFMTPTWNCWDCYCGWFSKHYLTYINSLRDLQLPDGIFWMAPSEAIKAVDRMRDPQPKYTDREDRSCPEHGYHQRNSDFVSRVREGVKLTKEGLCLDCFRSGGQHKMHIRAK